MADATSDNVDVVAEEVKEKEAVDSATKEDDTKEEEEESEKENGDSCEKSNGKAVSDDVDSAAKDEELVCPVKRKSTAGVDGAEDVKDGVTPEKKAKLDDAAADVESNGDSEVAA